MNLTMLSCLHLVACPLINMILTVAVGVVGPEIKDEKRCKRISGQLGDLFRLFV